MKMIIANGTVALPDGFQTSHVVVENGRISTLSAQLPPASHKHIDASGYIVAPGYIDVHIHGVDGVDTMDGSAEALATMGRFLVGHGVTSYYPTTMSQSREQILQAITAVAHTPQTPGAAHHLGVHVEGPYFNPEYCGAQDPSYFRDPDPEEYGRWFQSGGVKLITIAPERRGSQQLVEAGVKQGVAFAIAHSAADYDTVVASANWGVTQGTHTFNGMLGLHHRRPGTVGGILTDQRLYTQAIVDGIHLHPAIVRLIVQLKGAERTILISDAMRATGTPDGAYELGGTPVVVQDGVARTPSGNLAGSTLTLDTAVRNTMAYAGLPLEAVLPMATATPAKAMGIYGRKGVIAAGADADLILLDSDGHVALTMVAGEIAYTASAFLTKLPNP